jgi:hypothetical protein
MNTADGSIVPLNLLELPVSPNFGDGRDQAAAA